MPVTYTVIVNKKPVTFTSKCTDAQALVKLKALVESGNVTDAFAVRLTKAKKLSEKQLTWVHKFVHDAKNVKMPPPSNESAFDILKSLIGNKKFEKKSEEEFALDLVCQSRNKKLSDKQMEWVNKLAGVKPAAATTATIPERLKNPKTNRLVVVTYERALEISTRETVPAEWQKVIKYFKSMGKTF